MRITVSAVSFLRKLFLAFGMVRDSKGRKGSESLSAVGGEGYEGRKARMSLCSAAFDWLSFSSSFMMMIVLAIC